MLPGMSLAASVAFLLAAAPVTDQPAAAPSAADPAAAGSGRPWEKVVGDLKFSEGPAWAPQGYLLFEDVPRNRTMKLGPDDKATVFREPTGRANGLAFDRQGPPGDLRRATTTGGRRHGAPGEGRQADRAGRTLPGQEA